MRSTKTIVVTALTSTALIAGGMGIAGAASSSSPKTLACAANKDGALRLVSKAKCKSGEHLASWNTKGVKGDTGPAGPQGPTGATGATGATGVQGLQGLTGPQGIPGTASGKGDKGDKGDVGPAGAVGPAGPAGPAGPTGAVGISGYTIHYGYGTSNGSPATVSAYCPSGEVALGGGAKTQNSDIGIQDSYPSTTNPSGDNPINGWTVAYEAEGVGTAYITVYVTCAKVAG